MIDLALLLMAKSKKNQETQYTKGTRIGGSVTLETTAKQYPTKSQHGQIIRIIDSGYQMMFFYNMGVSINGGTPKTSI